MRTLVLLISCLVMLVAPAFAHAVNQSSGTITMEFDLSEQNAADETKLWIPYPLSDNDQTITNISVSGDFAESAVYSDKKYSTPILYARWDKGVTDRHLSLTFNAVRNEVIKKDFPKEEGAWNMADFSLYLEPTSRGPIDGVVKAQADKIVEGKTTVEAKAKAIYDWIVDNMYRDPETNGCGDGDVCSLLIKPGGKCTDIHSVFVSLCRAAGVPAREVFGIRQGKQDVVDITKWQHCWAEFYLPGYGWVPVDPADVRKMMLKHDLKLADAKTKEYREYFWGGWDPYRVKLAAGRDIVLTPAQQGAPVNTFGYPYAEVGGKVVDWLDPATFKYKITYRK